MDSATSELIRQAEAQAGKLENGYGASAPGRCEAHGELARGVSLSLRLLTVLAKERVEVAEPPQPESGWPWAKLATLGIPAPVCALFWAIGKGRGWW